VVFYCDLSGADLKRYVSLWQQDLQDAEDLHHQNESSDSPSFIQEFRSSCRRSVLEAPDETRCGRGTRRRKAT
jgi:hypothetical protein